VERAIETVQRALELQPDMPNAHNNMGNAYRDLEQYDRAMQRK